MNLDDTYLKSRLTYDPKTGDFRWKAKPGSTCYERSWNTRFAGTIAGSIQPNGYRYIGIAGRVIQAHRLAWLYMIGEWPPNFIDHKDRVRANNAFGNLRPATRSQNAANSAGFGSSGLKGASRCKNRWRAQIMKDGVRYELGYFGTAQEAHAAYTKAANDLFGEFGRAA